MSGHLTHCSCNCCQKTRAGGGFARLLKIAAGAAVAYIAADALAKASTGKHIHEHAKDWLREQQAPPASGPRRSAYRTSFIVDPTRMLEWRAPRQST